MAQLDYKNSLTQYRKYLTAVQDQPLLRQGLWLVLSLVLVIVLILAALRPTLVTIASLLGEIGQQSGVEKKLDKKIAAITAAQAEYLKNESRLSALDEALPVDPKYAVWAARIENIASESGVEVMGLSLVEGKNFTVSLAGNFSGLRRFLVTLENLRRLVEIENVRLDKKESLTLTINGVLKSYEEKQD